MKLVVGVNEKNRRVGESHPQAKLTDADVDRLLAVFDELCAVHGRA